MLRQRPDHRRQRQAVRRRIARTLIASMVGGVLSIGSLAYAQQPRTRAAVLPAFPIFPESQAPVDAKVQRDGQLPASARLTDGPANVSRPSHFQLSDTPSRPPESLIPFQSETHSESLIDIPVPEPVPDVSVGKSVRPRSVHASDPSRLPQAIRRGSLVRQLAAPSADVTASDKVAVGLAQPLRIREAGDQPQTRENLDSGHVPPTEVPGVEFSLTDKGGSASARPVPPATATEGLIPSSSFAGRLPRQGAAEMPRLHLSDAGAPAPAVSAVAEETRPDPVVLAQPRSAQPTQQPPVRSTPAISPLRPVVGVRLAATEPGMLTKAGEIGTSTEQSNPAASAEPAFPPAAARGAEVVESSQEMIVLVGDIPRWDVEGEIEQIDAEDDTVARGFRPASSTAAFVAARPGETRIAVVFRAADGNRKCVLYKVRVEADPRVKEAARHAVEMNQAIQAMYPRSSVRVAVRGDALVVSGEVPTERQAIEILRMVRHSTLCPVVDQLRANQH